MRKYLTSLMILFTLLLALGGMYLPSLLLDRQQAAVMEESGIVDVPSANKAEEVPGNTTQVQDSPATEETMLTSEEILRFPKAIIKIRTGCFVIRQPVSYLLMKRLIVLLKRLKVSVSRAFYRRPMRMYLHLTGKSFREPKRLHSRQNWLLRQSWAAGLLPSVQR